MDRSEEQNIIRMAVQGNELAWEMLFKQHFKPIYNYCLKLTAGNSHDAEDITQQAFITAARKIHKYKADTGTFRHWLLGILKKCTLKHYAKKHKSIPFDHALLKYLENPEKRCPPGLLIYETLALLPTRYSKVLEAKYIDKQTVREISESNQSTEKAIESLLTRAREKFRQVYERLEKKKDL